MKPSLWGGQAIAWFAYPTAATPLVFSLYCWPLAWKNNCCILPGDGIRETPPPKTNRHYRQNIYYMSLWLHMKVYMAATLDIYGLFSFVYLSESKYHDSSGCFAQTHRNMSTSDISERKRVVLSAVTGVLCQLQWNETEVISEWLSMLCVWRGVRQFHSHSFTEQSIPAGSAESRAGLLPAVAAAAVCSCKSLTWSRMWQPTPTAENTSAGTLSTHKLPLQGVQPDTTSDSTTTGIHTSSCCCTWLCRSVSLDQNICTAIFF